MKAAELEKQVSASLAEQVGRAPDDIACPDPLEDKVGEKVTRTVTDGSARLGATVTSAHGNGVGFNMAGDQS